MLSTRKFHVKFKGIKLSVHSGRNTAIVKTLTLVSLLALFALTGCATRIVPSQCNGARTHDWEAWNNLMPPANHAVHVVGKVTVNGGGWKATLMKRVPQGINPEILLLDLKITPPEGPATAPMLDLDVHYSENVQSGKFTRAQIFCGVEVIADIRVKEAH